MIERLLKIVLQDGIKEFAANPDPYVRYFKENHLLSDAEIAEYRTHFEAKNPKVYLQFPREAQDFPAFNIILGLQREEAVFLEEQGEIILDALDADDGAPVHSVHEREDQVILISSENMDLTLFHYYLAKFILRRARKYLIKNGVMTRELSGADVQPNELYIPAQLFVRRLTVSVLNEVYQVQAKEPKGYSVSGIHVFDPSTSVGGVTVKE